MESVLCLLGYLLLVWSLDRSAWTPRICFRMFRGYLLQAWHGRGPRRVMRFLASRYQSRAARNSANTGGVNAGSSKSLNAAPMTAC